MIWGKDQNVNSRSVRGLPNLFHGLGTKQLYWQDLPTWRLVRFGILSTSLWNHWNQNTSTRFVQAPNSTFNDSSCSSIAKRPEAILTAHTAPLDLKFGVGDDSSTLYVGMHGRWHTDLHVVRRLSSSFPNFINLGSTAHSGIQSAPSIHSYPCPNCTYEFSGGQDRGFVFFFWHLDPQCSTGFANSLNRCNRQRGCY